MVIARQIARTCAAVVALACLLIIPGDTSGAQHARNVTPHEAQSLIRGNPKVRVIDIRTPREFRAGHIAGAVNIDFYAASFRTRLSKLDRDATYLMHCARGVRSGASLRAFRDLGFTNVIHMPAGMNGWRRARLPLTKP